VRPFIFGRARSSRKARSYGVNVLKALQGVSPPLRLGAEAAHRFLGLLGAEIDSSVTAVEMVDRERKVIRETHWFGDVGAISSAKEQVPPERRISAPPSRQHNLQETRTMPWAETWSTSHDQVPTEGGQTQDAHRHAQGERSIPPEAPKLPSKSQWVVHGGVCPSNHQEDTNTAGNSGTDANNVGCGGQMRRVGKAGTARHINTSVHCCCTHREGGRENMVGKETTISKLNNFFFFDLWQKQPWLSDASSFLFPPTNPASS